jgi:hypothetical protein
MRTDDRLQVAPVTLHGRLIQTRTDFADTEPVVPDPFEDLTHHPGLFETNS